ncbi:MAG: hypothetical protein AAF617_04500 [Bacteroidota bacterium]
MNTKITLRMTIVCVMTSFLVNAQRNCQEKLSLFAENVKTKQFEKASPQLAFLRKNCATLSYATYAHGEKVIAHELKSASNKKQKATELIQLLKDRLDFFPDRTPKGTFLPKIGALMIKHNIGTISEQYQWFEDAFTQDKKNFKNPINLYYYFELYYKLYQAKTQHISLEMLIKKYEIVLEKLNVEKERNPKNDKAITTLSTNMNVLIQKEATCETLIPMYKKKLPTNRTNIDWLRKAAGQLDAKGCKEDALFIELVEAIDAIKPDADSKLYLHQIHDKKGNTEKATIYLNAYLTLEMDGVKKAKVLNSKGQKAAKVNQKSKAYMYFVKATNANPYSGAAYVGLARLYGASANECGTDSFSKRAIYWKAADTARKAMEVDPSIKTEAKSLIENYMQLAPSKPDIFKKGYKGGEKIALNCWIGGTVTVPNL